MGLKVIAVSFPRFHKWLSKYLHWMCVLRLEERLKWVFVFLTVSLSTQPGSWSRLLSDIIQERGKAAALLPLHSLVSQAERISLYHLAPSEVYVQSCRPVSSHHSGLSFISEKTEAWASWRVCSNSCCLWDPDQDLWAPAFHPSREDTILSLGWQEMIHITQSMSCKDTVHQCFTSFGSLYRVMGAAYGRKDWVIENSFLVQGTEGLSS